MLFTNQARRVSASAISGLIETAVLIVVLSETPAIHSQKVIEEGLTRLKST